MLKTLLHKTLLTAIAILLGGWAVAAEQYVVKGTTLNFKVDKIPKIEYHWSVTNITKGTSAVFLASKTNLSGNYTFVDAGDYKVKVYPEDSITHCFGDALTMVIHVDQAAPTAVFEDLKVPYVCAQNNGGDKNGIIGVSVLYNGPKPWTFKYSVDRAPAIMPAGADEIYTDEFQFDLAIPNATGKTHRAEILLVDAKTISGIPVEENLDKQTLEVDVLALPNTQFGDYQPIVQAGTTQSYTATIEKAENYELFAPADATIFNENTTRLSDNFHSNLSFDVQWGNTPGDYQIKLIERSAFDCAGDTVYANITLVESFVVSLGNDISICKGESTVLTPVIDFDGSYSYLWSDGSTGTSLTVKEAGDYTVTATDNNTGKTSKASVHIRVLDIPMVDLGADYQLADGEVITLDAGNPGSTFTWSTGDNKQSIQVSTSNTYSVVVTNANSCSASDEIIVSSVSDVFAIDLGADKDICEGDQIVLNPNPSIAQDYTYLWSNGANTPTLTVNESGTYSVTVRDSDGNEKTDEVLVTVHALPIVDLGDDIVLYDGETATLDAGDAGNNEVYEWNTGESSQTITVTDENVYSVKVTTEFGCSNSDNTSVIRKDGHKFSVDLGGDIQICEGDRVYLEPTIDRSFSADPIYKWIPSESTDKGIFVNQTGKYCVNVTDPFGNTEGDCIELVVNPSPIVDLGEDVILPAGSSVELDAENDGSFYRWSTDEITQKIDVDKAGDYWVEVTNQQSCMGRDTVNIQIPGSDQFVGLASGFSPNGDGKNDVLFVRGNNIATMNLIVYNRLGHKIFQSNRQDVGWDGTYRGVKQDMDVYVYFLKVTFLDGSSVQKRGNVTLLY
ncbi:gliding motility-associated C-terminal domain-containing protein [Ancylomarina longa]|uniref:Gliding motility-associated C-terminal domain-containing protein n=1 Tax=Ancylomarina longa TaxID=2487017 RepID=A0A434AVT5_9BACT|nr:gliding motility-associated C-terminal domain-containing protein [Ancylomarina longa]RUT78484.1 gliding motility-associated C-terminal domain-containing protein [Ancylomarina longa]